MANGVGHRDHGQAEGERNPEDPNAELWKGGPQHRAPAAGEYQPERANALSEQPVCTCQHLLLIGKVSYIRCSELSYRLTVWLPTLD
jgi:hypothetical protein